MKETVLIDKCLTCGMALEDGRNIKTDWHMPICNKCRSVLLNYHLNKDRIDRVIRFRAKQMGD